MLLGIDLGQSSVKVTALAPEGAVYGSVAREYPTAHTRPGWSEQLPDDWIAATARACRDLFSALAASGAHARVAGVGLSAATHHAVLLDARDRPLRPCIMLTDARASEQAARLMAAHGPLILGRARNVASAGWTLPQLLWIAEQEPTVWASTARLVFAKDYLRLAMTGAWATDRIDAEGSLLYDPVVGRWDEELCALIDLPPHRLPPACEPTAITGAISGEGERLFGIPAGTPVVAGCSDTAAEALAAGAIEPGGAIVKLATAGNVNSVTRTPEPRAEWFTYSHPVPGLAYHALGTNAAASSLRWLRDLLRDEHGAPDYAALDALAAQAPPGADGVLFHPYLLGERAPYWDPDLRASFIGLRAAHGRAHLTRAVLEGVALSLADCMEVFREHGVPVASARIVGGGARSALWRQIVADVLGLRLAYPSTGDASYGAALLAGVGAGIYASHAEAVAQTVRIVAEHAPDPRLHSGYHDLLAIYREAQRRLAPIDRALAGVRFT